jgi:hypothetical protein
MLQTFIIPVNSLYETENLKYTIYSLIYSQYVSEQNKAFQSNYNLPVNVLHVDTDCSQLIVLSPVNAIIIQVSQIVSVLVFLHSQYHLPTAGT